MYVVHVWYCCASNHTELWYYEKDICLIQFVKLLHDQLIHLLSCVHGIRWLRPSSSTFICGGTSGCVPPLLDVVVLTPTPPLVLVDRWTSLSLHVSFNPSTSTVVTPSPAMEDVGRHSSSTMNDI